MPRRPKDDPSDPDPNPIEPGQGSDVGGGMIVGPMAPPDPYKDDDGFRAGVRNRNHRATMRRLRNNS